MYVKQSQRSASNATCLEGQLLIAMPTIMDEPFSRSIVYICAHSPEGAMGIVLNRAAPGIEIADLFVQLELTTRKESSRLPDSIAQIPVLIGGPVEPSRGFVLHSHDFHLPDSTLPIDDSICLTATVDILRAIAQGEGPDQSVLALGYAGWQAGQLEAEIQANGWLTSPANADLIFNAPIEARYELAMRCIGVNPAMLSMDAGHA
jgi:putative transcriptional regulator